MAVGDAKRQRPEVETVRLGHPPLASPSSISDPPPHMACICIFLAADHPGICAMLVAMRLSDITSKPWWWFFVAFFR